VFACGFGLIGVPPIAQSPFLSSSMITHVRSRMPFALDLDHGLGDVVNELSLLVIGKDALDDLDGGNWHGGTSSFGSSLFGAATVASAGARS